MLLGNDLRRLRFVPELLVPVVSLRHKVGRVALGDPGRVCPGFLGGQSRGLFGVCVVVPSVKVEKVGTGRLLGELVPSSGRH